MKPSLLLSLFTVVAFSSASARIGMTFPECKERYGLGNTVLPKIGTPALSFQSSGMVITMTFFENKVDSITYRNISLASFGPGEALSPKEIEQLLKFNRDQSLWKKREVNSLDPEWQTYDGKLFAIYKTSSHSLLIGTKGYFERAAAARQSSGLQGF